ncbi:dual specificity protein kinase Ttk [Puntigrus tetrazona]|uniref:dual specificity protein kinase Ttk n=1 Tax=Puntigrus tetrazona TaxID=1606681 RepID=UPI001C89AA11|nr:dual specificity protein kinase Ttk [Puntigrus tetrazona]
MLNWSGDFGKTSSDWNIYDGLTPARTASNWSVDVNQTPVRTVSDWSTDILRSASDCSINASLSPVFSMLNWSGDFGKTSSDWNIYDSLTPARTVSDWSADIIRTASDCSINASLSPVFSMLNWSGDFGKTSSDWNIYDGLTPARTASNWSVDVNQTPVRTVSDWSTDILRSASDCSINASLSPVFSMLNWSGDFGKTSSDWNIYDSLTPARTVSDWSTDILRTASDCSINASLSPVFSMLNWSGDFGKLSSAWNIYDGLTPARTASNWSVDVNQTPGASDWSTDILRTASDCSINASLSPVFSILNWSGDFGKTSSDWNIYDGLTPARTASNWSVDVNQTPVRTVSDWSVDITHTPDRAASDWSADIAQTPVRRTPSDWSIAQTPVYSTSNWNANVIQTSACSAEVSASPLTGQLEKNGKMKIEVINSCHYVIGDMLGEGSFGAVYEGSRLQDGFKVALKYVGKTENVEYISIPDYSKPLPIEVALHILANRGPSIPEIIQLLDWQDQHDHYIMVMERPSPCEDLFEFAERHGGSIDEDLARIIVKQATQAAYMCCCRGVLHGDIKLENLLISRETHEVKLIDFGCGDFLKKSAYKIFIGSDQYCPPEFYEKGEYNGKPATVWSLGVLLFALVFGDFPSADDLYRINAKTFSKAGLSEECCQLMSSCLQQEPEQRLQLSEILLHDWFKLTDGDPKNSVVKRTGTPIVAQPPKSLSLLQRFSSNPQARQLLPRVPCSGSLSSSRSCPNLHSK